MLGPLTPVVVSVKSPASTPVTASLKVTSNCTLDALVGLPPWRTMLDTVGTVLSLKYDGPPGNFCSPAPRRASHAASTIESSSTRSRRIVPSPEPVATVTMYVLPDPLTLDTLGPLTPVVVSV